MLGRALLAEQERGNQRLRICIRPEHYQVKWVHRSLTLSLSVYLNSPSFSHPLSIPYHQHFGLPLSSIYSNVAYFTPSSLLILSELDLFSKCIAMNTYIIFDPRIHLLFYLEVDMMKTKNTWGKRRDLHETQSETQKSCCHFDSRSVLSSRPRELSYVRKSYCNQFIYEYMYLKSKTIGAADKGCAHNL